MIKRYKDFAGLRKIGRDTTGVQGILQIYIMHNNIFFLRVMEKKEVYWISAIFLITLSVRLILAFTLPNFTYESYFDMRQVDHITKTGLPLFDDPLSYGGRHHLFLPFFHYLTSLFSLALPLSFVAKILPNLFIAALTIITYLISRKITQNKTASLFSAGIAGFLPILFTTNRFTSEMLFLPLIFVNIYTFLNINRKQFLYGYIISFIILSFTSSATFLLLIGFGIYFLLSLLEKKKIDNAEIEVVLFSLFFFIWSQYLFFKDILLEQGISFIWKNIPAQIISQYFPMLSLTQSVILVSVIPFLTGIFVVYRSLFYFKNERMFFLISLVISTTLLTWLRFIEFKLSLAFTGIILAILFAPFYQDTLQFLQKTKIHHLQKLFPRFILVLLVITMIYPAITTALQQEMPTTEEVTAFQWIKENIPEDATILALLEEGHLITFIGNRTNFMDDQFTLIPDVEKRFAALTSLFTTQFQTEAISLFDEYNIRYIVLTPSAREKYNLTNLQYRLKECFERIYDDESTKIYDVRCTLEKSQGG